MPQTKVFGAFHFNETRIKHRLIKPSVYNYIPPSCEIIHFCPVIPIETLPLTTIFALFMF